MNKRFILNSLALLGIAWMTISAHGQSSLLPNLEDRLSSAIDIKRSPTAVDIEFQLLGLHYQVQRKVGTLDDTAAGWEDWGTPIFAGGPGTIMRVLVPDPASPPPIDPATPADTFRFHLSTIQGQGQVLVSWVDSNSGDIASVILNRSVPSGFPPFWNRRITGPDYQLTITHLGIAYEPGELPPVSSPAVPLTDPTLLKLTDAWDAGELNSVPSGSSGQTNLTNGTTDYFRAQLVKPDGQGGWIPITNPEDATDTDGDGLADWIEFLAETGSNPFLADTDGDGVSDYDEVIGGSDPANFLDRAFDSSRPPAYADVWIDPNADLNGHPADGSRDLPFDEFKEAIAAAPAGSLIGVKAGFYNLQPDLNPVVIDKELRFVAVDGPEQTLVAFSLGAADGSGIRIVDPSFANGAYSAVTWEHGMDPEGENEELPADPMTVEFHGFRFIKGLKAISFFTLPGTKLVLANCYLNGLLCGVAECHSSEILVLGCQVAESGDVERSSLSGASLGHGVFYLRGNSQGEFWNTTIVDSLKQPDHGTIHLEQNASIKVRNSILWESFTEAFVSNSLPGDIGSPLNAHRYRVLTVDDPDEGEIVDPLVEDSTDTTPGSAYQRLNLLSRLDVQSSLLFTSEEPGGVFDNPFPSPNPLAPNLPYEQDIEAEIFQPHYLPPDFDPLFPQEIHDAINTRYLSYSLATDGRSPSMDGVTSSTLDTSTGLIGPLGYAHLLRYDLLGRARHEVYRNSSTPVTTETNVDLGAVETVPTLRDSSQEIQRAWTDLAVVTPASDGTIRVAATGSTNEEFAQPGQIISLDDLTTGRGTIDGTQFILELDQLNENSTIAAACFDSTTNRFFAFGDQRRGGIFFNGFTGDNGQRIFSTSEHLGCSDAERNRLGSCILTDYKKESLRGCFLTLSANPLVNGNGFVEASLLEAPEGNSIDTFLGSGMASDSPSAFQETMGLRAAIRDTLISISDSTIPYHTLNPGNGFPDGVIVAVNTLPKFGIPLNGWLPTGNGGEFLDYSGGGSTTQEGEIIHVEHHPGGSGDEFTLSHDISNIVLAEDKRSEVYFRAWPYFDSASGPVYGTPFDASVILDGDSDVSGEGDGNLDPQPFPLVINEVMSGTSGWIEVFNTWGQTVSGSILSGVVLKAHVDQDETSNVTAQRDLSNDSFPPRSLTVVAISPEANGPLEQPELALSAGDPTEDFIIEDSGNVRFDQPTLDDDGPLSESFIGRDRFDGQVSEGRAWDGGPMGEDPFSGPHEQNHGAAFGAIDSIHPVTRRTSNTASFTDPESAAPVRQPYFQAKANETGTTAWVAWRNLGHLGASWDSDGLRQDFLSARVEGSAFKDDELFFGLRSPLTKRRYGAAIVVKAAESSVINPAETWKSLTGVQEFELNLDGKGIHAIQWCPEVDASGKFLIVAGPASTDPDQDHPSVGSFSLWSWDGTTNPPTRRIAHLGAYARNPSGVATFTHNNTQEKRIIFCEARPPSEVPQIEPEPEVEHILHWPISILN